MSKRLEFESVIIYTSVLETIIKGAFSDGAYTGNKGEDYAKHYASEKAEWVREHISNGIIVKYDDLQEETTTEEK
jgi:hypothetical protein